MKIRINLLWWRWEANCPIRITNVNREKAEQDLYERMRKAGYTDKAIREKFALLEKPDFDYDDDEFFQELDEQEQESLLANGGVFCDDTDDDEVCPIDPAKLCCPSAPCDRFYEFDYGLVE